MTTLLMKCGHTAQGVDKEGNPVCVICWPNPLTKQPMTAPDLSGRRARCVYYDPRKERRYGCGGMPAVASISIPSQQTLCQELAVVKRTAILISRFLNTVRTKSLIGSIVGVRLVGTEIDWGAGPLLMGLVIIHDMICHVSFGTIECLW